MRENLEQESSGHKVINPLNLLNMPNKEMDSNSRKRKIESEESNDEDAISVKSAGVKSLSSSEEESKLTYGLKHNFLKSLGIRPPIERWVYVCNFRCDKTELKEVLEVAGHVVTCAMFAKNGKMAKVMYSHPLEAVQAVSMLHGQMFYGQKLHVSMMNCPTDTLIMPKGLTSVGPGLGIHGRPLRDVAKQYSKYLKRKVSLIDHSIFVDADDVKCNETVKEEYDSDNDGNDINERRQENRLKLVSVEDLPDDAHSESKNKKAKREFLISDQDSEDGKSDKRSIASSEEPKAINTVTSQRGSNKGITQPKQNPNPSPKLDISLPTPVNNTGPQNYRSPMPYTSGPPIVTPPVRLGCPPAPTIGPLSQTAPVRPFGPQTRPTCPPVPMGPALRPVGPPRPIRPQSGPIGPQQGPIGPQQGPIGPQRGPICPPHRPLGSQPGPMGPQTRPMGPQTGPVGPLVRPMGPVVRPPGPFPSQVPSGPFMPPRPMCNPNLGPQQRMDPNMSGQQPITLQFRNLPPTTTFPLLCEKVAQCGQVLSLQLTTPGCAVARFAHKAHADRCFQIFNGKFIDGHVVEVRFVP